MSRTKAELKKLTLEHMLDEKFGELFFIAKEEYDIGNNTPAEEELYERLQEFKTDIKHFCQKNYGAHK